MSREGMTFIDKIRSKRRYADVAWTDTDANANSSTSSSGDSAPGKPQRDAAVLRAPTPGPRAASEGRGRNYFREVSDSEDHETVLDTVSTQMKGKLYSVHSSFRFYLLFILIERPDNIDNKINPFI